MAGYDKKCEAAQSDRIMEAAFPNGLSEKIFRR